MVGEAARQHRSFYMPSLTPHEVTTGPHLEVIAGLRLGVAAGRGRSAPAAGSHAGYGRPASAPST
jgi:hypothetical protein